jgi:hypothetical protein
MALALTALAGAAVVGTRVRKGRAASLPSAPAPSTTWPPLDRTATSPVPAAPSPSASPPAAAGLDELLTTSATGETELAPAAGDVVVAPATEDRATPADPDGAPVTEVVTIPPATPPVDDDVVVVSSDVDGPGSAPGGRAVSGDALLDAGVREPEEAPRSTGGTTWTFGGEGDTDSDRSAGSPLRADNPSVDPEPEAVLPTGRIDAARADSPLIASGDEGDVPPAPEPTFGTAPDPETAATAPVHVATPVEVEPDEPLAIPTRPSHDDDTGSAS